ncbi:MAG: NAD(P)/FAD-dependent oxidoreductase [Granulosicoccus sp.]|nr:NAD(P)/FAD-dependent oxidoreductase [Granulosicoccus sp.]
MLYRLRELEHRVLVVEKGSGVGGTWYWNRYPGARCDVASMEYSYQFDDQLQREWNWSERYSPQPEILRYANHVTDRFQLRPHIQFDATVVSASYEEHNNTWLVDTENSTGEKRTRSTTYLVAATGCLSSPNQPSISGLDQFRGEIYHTGQWPQEPIDFSGRRVGVIGTGSSGIQAIPVIAEQAKHLTVFQRTANYAVPARNKPMPAEERDYFRENYADLRKQATTTRNGQLTPPNPVSALAVDGEEREKQYEARWQKGGLAFIGSFNDLIVNDDSNKTAADFVKEKIRKTVKDRSTAEKLLPKSKIGCKRLCVDSGYYETYNRSNVSLIDISETPIEVVQPDGIRVRGNTIELDAIVLATGYDAMTGALINMNITGRDGVTLAQSWKEGPKTFMGIAIHGYPNLFTITGPGSPSVLTNMLPTIEQHVNLLTDILQHAQSMNQDKIEATLEAQESWVEHVNAIASKTIYPTCNSWYLGSNVPGKPRVFMPYVGFPSYVKHCEEMVSDGYAGLSFTKSE